MSPVVEVCLVKVLLDEVGGGGDMGSINTFSLEADLIYIYFDIITYHNPIYLPIQLNPIHFNSINSIQFNFNLNQPCVGWRVGRMIVGVMRNKSLEERGEERWMIMQIYPNHTYHRSIFKNQT